MKALIVEDELAWTKQIESSLRRAIPSLSADDIITLNEPESAIRLLKRGDGWQYRLILLDWGFVSGVSVATAADLAEFVFNNRKDALVIILTGAYRDKRMSRPDIIEPLIQAKRAEVVFKHEVSTKLDDPEKGLPKLIKRLTDMRLDEKLQQRAIYGFQFQSNCLSGTVQGVQYRFKERQAAIVKLLYDRLLNDFPGEVTKAEAAEAVRKVDKSRAEQSDWSPNDEFKESVDGKRFWAKHIFHKGAKGRYRLTISK